MTVVPSSTHSPFGVERSRVQFDSTFPCIPPELILYVFEFLQKGERYQCLSLCRVWLPFLYNCRTIQIVDDYLDTDELIYHPQQKLWRFFRDSKEHRDKILKIVYGDSFSGVSTMKPLPSVFVRKLKLCLNLRKAVEFKEVLLEYVDYFHTIVLTWHPEDDLVLNHPTSTSLTLILESKVIMLECLGLALNELHKYAETQMKSLLQRATPESIAYMVRSPSLAQLSGLHSMRVTNTTLKLRPCLDQLALLQKIELSQCNHVVDVTALLGIPVVKLSECMNITNIQPLAQAVSVVINKCWKIQDVSPLQNIATVVLLNMRLQDISMLGEVSSLTVRYCYHITKFPVPSRGLGQSWEFEGAIMKTVSGWGQLEKLVLIECDKLRDISMLGAIKYLELKNMSQFKLPQPIGKLQDWKVTEVPLPASEIKKLSGLHRLTIAPGPRATLLSGLSNIEYLYCKVNGNFGISNLKNIKSLDVDNTSDYPLHLAALQDVDCIRIKGDVVLELSAECQLKSLILNDVMGCNDQFLHNCKGALRMLRIKNCFFGEVKGGTVVVDCWPALEVLDTCDCNLVLSEAHTSQETVSASTTANTVAVSAATTIFDNFSLRPAVELWCVRQPEAFRIYGDINTWNVSRVTDMHNLFVNKYIFNSNINNWDVSKVTNMRNLFLGANSFNQPLDLWNVSNVCNMEGMFCKASSFNQPLDSWNVGKVSTMKSMFQEACLFNQPLETWDVHNVVNFGSMFHNAREFNQPLYWLQS
jgi:hypothetical protein